MYNASSNSWASYPTGLGQARGSLAAASLPSGLVFFAGGYAGAFMTFFIRVISCKALVFEATYKLHFTLFSHIFCISTVQGRMIPDACSSDSGYSAHTDIYNSSSASWTSDRSGLGQARSYIGIASLPSGLVFFAGGETSGTAC